MESRSAPSVPSMGLSVVSSSDSEGNSTALIGRSLTELAKDALGLETVGQTHERNS